MNIPVFNVDEKIKNNSKIFKVKVKNAYISLYVSSAGGNCKLMHISDLKYSLESNPEGTIERIKEIFDNYKKLCFEVNVDSIQHVELLNEHFPLLFCNKVPIGYKSQDGYTYFACFLTDCGFYSNGVTRESVLEKLSEENEDFKYECKFGK